MNFQEFIQLIFGENIAVTDVLTLILAVITPILSVFYNKLRNKLIITTTDNKEKDAQLKQIQESFNNLANMFCTAYLSSNTISPDVKKQLASYASKLDKLAGVSLTKDTEKLIEQVSQYIPNVNDKKEELLEAATKAEEVIDEVNDATKAALDKLKI